MYLETVRDVIKALGGPVAVSGITGCSRVTISAWQSRIEKFPAKTHNILMAELARRGYTAPSSLWGMLEAAE